ncbi:hypothetical protein BN871_DE_00160 [Paenibacillus sp. P22]|nr:hypothetical protein BN871_DE_00160 [Paenibacillus sp. P22]
MERVMGIEPTLSAWKAEVLPLNYTRGEDKKMVGMTRFEHATPWSQTRCSTKLSYIPIFKWRARRDSNSRPFDS